jgi:exopolyphosphatase/guanosine-5'-triphosphate,3'-diphosphate pyrophosphatase
MCTSRPCVAAALLLGSAADEEGMLSFQGATADVVRARGSDVSNAGVVDFGGRSCEVVVGQLGSKGVQRPSVMSLPIGCVTLANMLPSDSEDGTAVQMAIKRALEPYEQALQGVQGSAGSHAPIVMTGGTVTTAAALLLQLPTYEPPRVHMSRITSDQLRELASQLHTGHAAGMRSLPGWLSESRMSTLPAGCWALAHLLDLLAGQGGSAYVSDKDLLDGLMVSWLQELRQRCDK